ncbi:diphosphomevalonate decarboxylase [Salpingoeca rosetta]|uniref:Diphosphomevalonate decarboxylase n=1 Tax=Salpingoeca rosetta (strain ATCC 50818 / BSB-021) TaxID=946362 RepID=F2UMF1_SALR5|nr:diphosphomevalonate decarboxylase [Salpingoeca rosetta]EGD78300.1 diphosphomevalonate decarboxylase [Salpingoeca rosetta]|eukprot:XP_004989623.1 diphosphomevalonate decarboxylase [Salpingoeca rosetta]
MDAKRAKTGVVRATTTAPVNIAVIKYWGKRDTKLLLPINSSLSGTLDQEQLHARTTVAASSSFEADEIWLNGKQEDISNQRLQNVLGAVRALAAKKDPEHPLKDAHIKIASVNNFPTAAGLASSAAGYACLVAALAELFGVQDQELTAIARVGSGSACRSLMGGFVRWEKGTRDDGADSLASQVVPESHWPDMQVLILVVNAGKKGVSSTSGMQSTVKTSALINHRAEVVVPQRMKDIEKAIQDRDFQTFGRITMQDSNQFHATCLDTYPPIFYMNDVSRQIVQILTQYNDAAGEIRAAYTYDAGPNCVIYCLKQHVQEILSLVCHYFPSSESEFVRGRSTTASDYSSTVDAAVREKISGPTTADGVKYILHTGIGPGPKTLTNEDAFLIAEDGSVKQQA